MTAFALYFALCAAGADPAVSAAAGDASAGDEAGRSLILVIGAEGTPEYGREFSKWADRWEQAARTGGLDVTTIGRNGDESISDRRRLKDALRAQDSAAGGELWLVLIGHGTFDGRTARFNLRGPDVSAEELNGWLEGIERPLAVVNCASSSGPFINVLSSPGRVVVTAAKSGFEHNYARFGGYLSQAIADPAADLDKDGQTSLLEAWLQASRRTAEFYKSEGRLATEQSLLDDNGDKKGTPADWFRGVRPVRRPAQGESLDGYRAHQFHLIRSEPERNLSPELRDQRDELELAVIRLRDRKSEFTEDAYYEELERLLVRLANVYAQTEPEE